MGRDPNDEEESDNVKELVQWTKSPAPKEVEKPILPPSIFCGNNPSIITQVQENNHIRLLVPGGLQVQVFQFLINSTILFLPGDLLHLWKELDLLHGKLHHSL